MPSEDSKIDEDSISQSGSSFGSVRVHSLTLSYLLGSMKCDSWLHSWATLLLALALVVSPRVAIVKLCVTPTISHQFILACHLFPLESHKILWLSFSLYVYSFNAMLYLSYVIWCTLFTRWMTLAQYICYLQQWDFGNEICMTWCKQNLRLMKMDYSLIYCFAFNLRV